MYRLFDGFVTCDFLLPGIPSCESAVADVQVHLGSGAADQSDYEWIHHWHEGGDEFVLSCARRVRSDGLPQYLLRFPELADFEIQEDIVTCYPGTECREDTLRHLLLDQVIPRVWAGRGHLIVHASAVQLSDGRAVAFIGESGWGKSTLAGALAERGHRLLSDDSICLRAGENGVQVIPSYSGLRLNEDSMERLNMADCEWDSVSHYSDKRRFEFGGLEVGGPFHLDTLYMMARPGGADDLCIASLPGAEQLTTLIKRSFLLDIRDKRCAARQLTEASAVLRTVPAAYSLTYPRDYQQLPATCEAVERGLRQ